MKSNVSTLFLYPSRVIALLSVKYSGRVEMDVFKLQLRRGETITKITIDPEPCKTMLLEKLRESYWSLGDCCLCLQHTYVQGSAMAAMGEWRDEVGCSKLTSV